MNTMPNAFFTVLLGVLLCAGSGTAADPLVAGAPITAFQNAVVQIGARDNENLADIRIREPAEVREGEPQRETRAKSGTILRQTATEVGLRLNEVRIETIRIRSAGNPAVVESVETRPTLDITLAVTEPEAAHPASVEPPSF